MGNYDSKISKFIMILLIILIGIIVCFPIAYNNMPKINTETGEQYNEDVITKDTNEEEFAEDEEQDDPDIEYINSRKQKRDDIYDRDNPDLDSIEELNENKEYTQIEPKQNENIFSNAEQFEKEKNYNQAISEYETIAKNTNDNKIKAQCYEKIASNYAIIKRYGTALSFAQRAYNLAPTTSREFLLARLYYKTGSQDKANEYIKEILKRDFDKD